MKIGQNVIEEPVYLEEPSVDVSQFLPRETARRAGNVVLKFTELPPNAPPEQCRPATEFPYMKFPFKWFNPMQSQFLAEVSKDNNVVVCGRTSAGKTVVAEAVASYTLQELRKTDPCARVAYISPLKALASEKQEDWTSPGHDFYQYNISILTGDYILTDERKKELAAADIICMSSEMLGSRIRRNLTEKNIWVNEIRTLVVDECVPYETKIALADGSQRCIGELFDKNIATNVLSYDHKSSSIVSKKVVRYKKLPVIKQVYKVSFPNKKYLLCTEDEKMYVIDRGYECVRNLIHLKNIQALCYVKKTQFVRQTMGCKIFCALDNFRKKYNIRVNIGGRSYKLWKNWEAWCKRTTSDRAGFETKAIHILEIQKIETACANTAESSAKQRLFQKEYDCEIHYPKYKGIERGVRYHAHKEKEDRNKNVFKANNASNSTSNMVHGRWISSGQKRLAIKFARIFRKGKQTTCSVVKLVLENIRQSFKSKKELLYDTIALAGTGSTSEINITIQNPPVHEIQDSGQHRKSFLCNVWEDFFSNKETTWIGTKSFVMPKKEMQKKVVRNSCKNISKHKILATPIEYVYDIEVEETHNFFANGILVHNCHLITMPERGPNLEVALMKFTAVNPKCRVIFLSATMPNVEELGGWLTKLNGKQTTILRSDYRPVDLRWNFEQFSVARNYRQTEENKIKRAIAVINSYPNDKFICFVHGKKTGRVILDILKDQGVPAQFHNADLNRETRASIEASFKSREPGSLRVLVSTSTLAWGLNMPARRVLIVGLHRGINLVEPLDIIQMGGRAGRVGLDTHGDVHVLIRNVYAEEDTRFCTIVQPIVSRITDISALAFHMVSEISEGAVKTPQQAINWYVRSLAHHQGILEKTGAEWDSPEELVKDVLQKLTECRAVTTDVAGTLYATPIGKVASWFYFSPFDVADWAGNFRRVLKTRNPSDHELAWAIANTFSNRQDYPVDLNGSAVEFSNKMPADLRQNMVGGVEKHSYAVYCLLKGKEHKDIDVAVAAIASRYRIDGDRIAQTLEVLGTFGKMFDGLPGQDALLEVPYRMRYGLGIGLELLVLHGIGRKTAIQILGRGVKTCKELLVTQESATPIFTKEKWGKIKDQVLQVARLGHIEYLKRLRKNKKDLN